jgi:cytoskeletal protein CcmA (bactofilin family)
MSSQGIPPLSTNAWNDTYANVLFTSGEWDAVYSYVNSDSATNNTDYNRTTYVNVTGDTITGELDVLGSVNLHDDTYVEGSLRVDGHTYLSAAMYVENDSHIMGDLRVDGDVWLAVETTNPKSIYLGATNLDRVVFHADVDSNIIPDDNVTYDLGTSTQQWRELFVQDISATNNIFVDNDLLVSANGTIGEDFRVSGHTTVGGDTVLSGTLDVKGFTTLHDDLSVRGDLYVDGNAYLSAGVDGNIYVGDVDTDNVIFRADVDSGIKPDDDITYDLGTSTQQWRELFVKDISATNDIFVDNDLLVSANGTIGRDFRVSGHTAVNGNTTLSGTLDVDDATYVYDTLDVKLDTRLHSNLFVTNNTTVSGNTTLSGTLDVDDAAYVYDTLDVELKTTLHNDLLVSGNTHIVGDLRVDGNAYLSAGVDGIINVGDTNTDNVVFHADIDSNIIPDDDVTYDLGTSTQQWQTLYVQDISATGDVTIDDKLTVQGHVSAVSGMTLTGDLTADDSVYIKGNIVVEGHAYFGYGAGSNQINLGDPNVDEIVVHADIGSDLIPYPGSTHDLGMRSKRWRELFVDTVDATGTIQTTGNISTSGAYVQSKSITFDQHVQTIENVWRSQSGQPHNTTLTVETFDHTKYQSAQYTIMIQSDPIQTGDNSVTTVNASFVSDGTTINGTVYGDVNVGPVDPLIGVNMTGNNNMYTLNITVGPYAKMMVTGKAMFLQ